MVEGEASNLVEWDQDLAEELLVLGLQGQREPVNDATQNLQQLAHSVEVFRFVDKSGKKKRKK